MFSNKLGCAFLWFMCHFEEVTVVGVKTHAQKKVHSRLWQTQVGGTAESLSFHPRSLRMMSLLGLRRWQCSGKLSSARFRSLWLEDHFSECCTDLATTCCPVVVYFVSQVRFFFPIKWQVSLCNSLVVIRDLCLLYIFKKLFPLFPPERHK